MKSKLAKVSFILLALSILLKIVGLFLRVQNEPLANVIAELTTILIIGFAIVALVFVIVDYDRGRYKRAVAQLAQVSTAYICGLEYSSTYHILSANKEGLTLWKLKGQKPVAIQTWGWQGLRLEKASIHVTAAKSFDGIVLQSPSGPETRLVIYAPQSGVLSRPLREQELDAAIEAIRNSNH